MKLRFIGKQREIDNVYTFRFDAGKPVRWQPGQYLHYDLPHPADDRGIGRFFTISAAPFEKNIALTTRFDEHKSSSFKDVLLHLKEGDRVEAGEPRGDFLLEQDASRHVLIAGGIGITPYHSMLTQLDHDGMKLNVDLRYANRDNNFVFDALFEELQKTHSEFNVYKYVGDERIKPDDLKKYLGDEKIVFYISGPRPMVENYEHMLEELDVPPERVKTDYFPGYQLG